MITPDGRRLIATRGLRGYADGLVAASLAGYLGDQLGYSATRIGVIVTGMLLGSAVPPWEWSYLILATNFMGGSILCCLGIIGEYLGRTNPGLNRINRTYP